MSASGASVKLVVRNRGLNHVFPRYSPDGERLVYMTFDPTKNLEDETLRTVRADGTANMVLTAGGQPDL